MMYLKTSAGPGEWDLYPADNLRYSSTYFQVPDDLLPKPRQAGDSVGPDIDWRKFFTGREVAEAFAVCERMHVCVPRLDAETKFEHTDDCVRWAMREHQGLTYFHVFQGDAYVVGENGQTIERV
jgi:hypothetical protein